MKPNQYRILVYPNITHQKDLRQDSWVYVMKNVLTEINKLRDDLFFTILTTHHLKELEFDNTEQLIVSYPSYPNSMRTHFDFEEISQRLDLRNNDYDIVWTHLPEHTLQLKNLIKNTSNCNPIFIGYSHWWEFKESTFYDQTMIHQNLIGLLEMDICGINCEAQKDKVIETSKSLFNKDRTDQLRNILTPQYLGSEIPQLSENNFDTEYPIIVWNHRVHAYKGWDFFKDCMNELWEKRQDFRLWVSFQKDSNPQRAGLSEGMLDETICYDRDDYYKKLESCLFGVACNSKFMGWNVSATDGLSVGLPYVFWDSKNYRELAQYSGLYFKSKKRLVEIMNGLLDHHHGIANEMIDVYPSLKKLTLERAEELRWDNQIHQFNDMFQKAINKLMDDTFSQSETLDKILNIIESEKHVKKSGLFSKNNLNWSKRITFQKYRNSLRKHHSRDVSITKDGYTWIK